MRGAVTRAAMPEMMTMADGYMKPPKKAKKKAKKAKKK